MNLNDLALKYKTDKSSAGHAYADFYEFLLKDRHIDRLLEIGIGSGGSLAMWHDYLPEATIYGIDHLPKMFHCKGVKTFVANQRKSEELLGVVTQMDGPLDVILDDGSHETRDQVVSLNTLFPFLKNNGLYIIEDIVNKEDIEPYLQDYKYYIIENKAGKGSIIAVIQKNA